MTEPDFCIQNGYIAIDGQRITAVGIGDAPTADYDHILDAANMIAMPGFINTHTHAAMTLFRGYADDLPLMEWLEQKIWPLEAKLTGEYVYWGTMLALVEMIKSGTTCFADMYFFMEDVARAVEKSGMKAVLSRGMIGFGPGSELAITESRELVSRWNGAADGRIKIILGPHAPYTCPPEYMRRVLALADELQVGLHIHLAETAGEVSDCQKAYGKSPAAHLEALGFFAHHPVLAAHCVYMDQDDIDILAKYSVGVAHNPESNMKLASGIAPVPEMLKAGLTVSLGTDGASSNNNLDMLEEMRTCALLHKVNSGDPTVIPAYQALQMATVNGAKALGLDGVGQIAPGKRADIIMIRKDAAHFIPHHDLIANLVYSAHSADVDTVIVDGKIIMQDRILTTIDEKEILQQAHQAARQLAKM